MWRAMIGRDSVDAHRHRAARAELFGMCQTRPCDVDAQPTKAGQSIHASDAGPWVRSVIARIYINRPTWLPLSLPRLCSTRDVTFRTSTPAPSNAAMMPITVIATQENPREAHVQVTTNQRTHPHFACHSLFTQQTQHQHPQSRPDQTTSRAGSTTSIKTALMALRTHQTRSLTPSASASATTATVTVRPQHKASQSVFQSMWIGATAGMGGIIAVYPVDVVKTRMQHSRVSSSAVQVLNNIIKHEGVVSFYKGLGPQLCGTVPDKAVSLATREYVKGKFADPNAFVASLASAVCSGITQSVVMNPVEIVKVRMQIDSSLNAAGVIRELGLRGVYRGYSACVARDVMFAATYFTLYDYSKRKLQIEDGSSLGWAMAAASTAGIPAAFFSTPLDVLKTRMQSRGAVPSLGFVGTLQQVYSEGGMNALFAGWGPRVGRIAPQFGIVLVSYDWLQHHFSTPNN